MHSSQVAAGGDGKKELRKGMGKGGLTAPADKHIRSSSGTALRGTQEGACGYNTAEHMKHVREMQTQVQSSYHQ
jgi:hypothetical protein